MGGVQPLQFESVTVLYVEDDPQLREAVTAFMAERSDDVEVVSAPDPATGLELLSDSTVDCIVSDFEMPEMDGIEFLEAVRADHPDLPFVLYTGRGSEEVASDAISAGVTDYVQKGRGSAQYEVLANRVENVVEQYRARRAVDRTERRYQRLIEESTDVTSVLDETGRYRYVSPAAAQEFGYEPDALLGEMAFEYVHPEDRDGAWEEFAKLAEHPGRRTSVELRFQRPDGSYTWVESRGRNLLDDPLVEGIVVYSRDVSERKEHARELEAVSSQFQFAVEASNVSVFKLDVDTMEIENIAWSDESLIGLREMGFEDAGDFVEQIHSEDRERLTEMLSEVVSEGTHVSEQVRATHVETGERRWLEISGGLYEGGPEPTILGLVRDVTDQRERERELARQNERLDQFASIVSHDLRNPLGVVRGRLELARATGDDEHLDTVERELDRMEELIDGLLALSRQGELDGETVPTSVESAAEAAWRSLESGSVELVVETDPTVTASPERLRELLGNLFRNSLEHGGDVSTVTVGGLADGGFFVADDGVGIPTETREDVLESGYSGGDSTGLGLAIVVAIAEAHGWRIDVTESGSGGARFEFVPESARDAPA